MITFNTQQNEYESWAGSRILYILFELCHVREEMVKEGEA